MTIKERQQQNINEKSGWLCSSFAQSTIKAFVTSTTVASVLYPVNLWQTRMQVGATGNFSSNPFMLAYGFLNANRQSLLKTSVSSNQESLTECIESATGRKKAFFNMFMSSVIIAFLDTFLTQYYSNSRVLNGLQIIPVINTRALKFILARQGLEVRLTRNFITTLGCIGGTTTLSDIVNPFLAKNTYPLPHFAATTFVTAVLLAPLISALDVIGKNQLKQINPFTLQTPSYQEVIKELFSKGGLSSFMRGWHINIIYTTTAFGIIHGVSWGLNEYVFKPAAIPANNPHSFFKPQKQPAVTSNDNPSRDCQGAFTNKI